MILKQNTYHITIYFIMFMSLLWLALARKYWQMNKLVFSIVKCVCLLKSFAKGDDSTGCTSLHMSRTFNELRRIQLNMSKGYESQLEYKQRFYYVASSSTRLLAFSWEVSAKFGCLCKPAQFNALITSITSLSPFLSLSHFWLSPISNLYFFGFLFLFIGDAYT